MTTYITTVAEPKAFEDPLSYLPRSKILEFDKKDTIFAQAQPSTNLYLMISGKVAVCRAHDTGQSEFLLDIYKADEFFGESALIGYPRSDTAVAIEDTKVMAWTTAELERIVGERPKLATALIQLVVQRSAEFANRIECFALDSIPRRLSRALLRFSDRFGDRSEGGAVHMFPFTHELLSHYVGTSREIITQYMKQFRSEGHVRYSRKEMVIYPDGLKERLKSGRKTSTEAPLANIYMDAAVA